MKPKLPRPANTPDFEPVAICFAENAIGELFSELLESRGVETRIIQDLSSLGCLRKIITEPQFLQNIDEGLKSKCLVVGDCEALQDLSVQSLPRPLTESKVEQALSSFLKS